MPRLDPQLLMAFPRPMLRGQWLRKKSRQTLENLSKPMNMALLPSLFSPINLLCFCSNLMTTSLSLRRNPMIILVFCLIFVVFDHCKLYGIHLKIMILNYYQYIHGLYFLSPPVCVIFKHNHTMSHRYCHRCHFYTFHSQNFFDCRHSYNQLSS